MKCLYAIILKVLNIPAFQWMLCVERDVEKASKLQTQQAPPVDQSLLLTLIHS